MLKFLVVVMMSLPIAAGEVIDVFDFATEAQEKRYQSLIAIFRCPKCLNTNLAGSDGPIAADLRREVSRMVMEDLSDEQITEFMQSRYGDFVLYDPPFRMDTWVLWLGPLLVLLLGSYFLRGLQRSAARAMNDEERADLEKLLGERDASNDQD
ncbi:MAG: cytochrome c-type biogenesis protein CcmH [Pseudomonadales bacterium]|nr:cytochrome c-type biogenesis protein CcmH [Pseudomonadales bacterium]